MPLKIINLKSINNLKYLFAICLGLSVHIIVAQEIINEQTPQEKTNVVNPQTTDNNALKIDGIAAVVGDYIILQSDIPKNRQQLEAGGYPTKNINDCELMGKLLEDKLYAHHAIQDSIEVNDADIRRNVAYQTEQFLQQLNGSMEKLLELYNMEDEQALKDEMFEINKANMLASKMQEKIVSEVEITPEEVREFFNKIPKEERPIFGTELKVAQIVAKPKESPEEIQRIIDKLNEFKTDVLENGASFRTKAVLYSEDPGSSSKGGKYVLNRNKPRMVKEFREVAFALQEGEISEPFKTDYGYHIILCEKIRGQEYDVAHILLTPKISNQAVLEAKERLEKIRNKIVSGSISFADAAKESSDEKETKFDGGQLINPQTQDYNFELTKMDTELYGQIQNLKDGEVSPVLTEQDRTGKVTFKILKVTDRINEHEANYARDYLKIKELALNDKKIKAISKWQKEKILDTYIKISGKYRNCTFTNNWLKE